MRSNKKYQVVLLPLIFLWMVSLTAQSGRIELDKEFPGFEKSLSTQRRIHPAEQYFHSQQSLRRETRSDNFEKLLVLLVDFQEDNDPLSTGNGKFMLEPDPNYPISIGAPPHDYEYFTAILESMKFYYLAASLGNFELDYDIYPLENDSKFAYTLPHQMGYYNPGLNNYDLFIERIEQYFQDIFTVADSYGEIDFGQYAHYLIIHAGSDWQHDIFGDTPYDLPSFFIQIGEGKEVWVNDGTVMINHACNVPETISQDGRYGVINAVIAHEFGHSLGFVDLYNTSNFYPGVGYWDIMDSGGSGRLVTVGFDGELYAIEGGLPALPGAWHRLLVWGEVFKEMGLYKQITDLPIGISIALEAASSLYNQQNPVPRFVRVDLNATEYLLLENRNVDPDGDGGIAFRGAAPITPGGVDYRVLLYPTAIHDDDVKPIYEYDWLLPGWINRFGESFGGGLVVWHIDEKVIFEEGITYEDGTFASNYEINRVNANANRRGVRIIEADNIYDIGNPYSWYWYGTEYEPFFRYKPMLDIDGFFINWSYEPFSNTLSSRSKPPLLTNSGYPSLYRIYDISSPSGLMSFKYSFEPFEHTGVLNDDLKISYLGSPASSSFLNAMTEMPIFTDEGVRFQRHFFEPENDLDVWEDFFGAFSFPYSPTKPVVSYQEAGSATKFYVTSGNKLIKIADDVGNFTQVIMEFDNEIIETPLLIEKNNDLLLVISTENELIIKSEFELELENPLYLSIPESRVCYDGDFLWALSQNSIWFINFEYLIDQQDHSDPLLLFNSYDLPVTLGTDYYPVVFSDIYDVSTNALFFQADNGDIYKVRQEQDGLSGRFLEKFFTLGQYTFEKPTQLSLGNIQNRVYIFFAAGEHLFAVDINGNLARGYPRYLENKHFLPKGDIRILDIDEQTLLVLPVREEGYLLYEYDSGLIFEYSIIWDKPDFPDHFYWEEESERLYFFFADDNGYLYENIFTATEANPIIWNGYRNNGWGVYRGIHIIDTTPSETVIAYAFPNPARTGEVRIRVEGAQNRIDLQLFDISGKRLLNQVFQEEIATVHDIILNTSKMATGVYFGVVKTNGKTTNFKLAIEK